MAQVFLSYCHEEKEFALKVVEALNQINKGAKPNARRSAADWYIWWDRDGILGGEALSEKIREEINHSAAVLSLWSSQSEKHDWAHGEALHAHEQKKLLLAMIDENASKHLPIPFKPYAWLNLTNWNRSSAAKEILGVWFAVDTKVRAAETTTPKATSLSTDTSSARILSDAPAPSTIATICYATADVRAAKKLKRDLQKIRIPRQFADSPTAVGPVPNNISPIALLPATKSASLQLATPRFLLAVCSVASAKSAEFDSIVTEFAQQYGADRVLPIILARRPADLENLAMPASLLEAARDVLASPQSDGAHWRLRAFLRLSNGWPLQHVETLRISAALLGLSDRQFVGTVLSEARLRRWVWILSFAVAAGILAAASAFYARYF